MRRLLLVLAACGGDPQGEPTGSTCPATNPPTYASFGQAFFTSYCIECHSETKTGDARNGAPVTIDFDTRSLVRMATSNIDKLAAFGPSAHNSIMPPDGHPAPTDAERTQLGQYIACEVSGP